MRYKSTEELSNKKLKSDTKFEEKLTWDLKNDMRNLANVFTRAPESVKIWWNLFVQSRKDMTLKFTEELCVMTMKNNAKFKEELTFHFKTDMRNLTNFDSSTWKSKKIALYNWLLWPKYIMFELRKVQRSYVWWHWRLMQNLKEKWLVLSKMTWGIWQICIGWSKWIANLTKLFTHV